MKIILLLLVAPLNCSTKTSIDFAKHAKEQGADVISLIYRAYLFFDEHVYNHYKAVADAVPCSRPLRSPSAASTAMNPTSWRSPPRRCAGA